MALCTAIALSNCATTRHNDLSRYNLSLKNTLSIFLLNNEKDYYFCIPIQYVGDYQIARFEFNNGNILIDDYDILLKRNEINISVYLNETADIEGDSVEEFNLIYLEEKGKVLVSKMAEPLAVKNKSDNMMNHYYIFIEKHLTGKEMKNIINKYEKGKVYSKMSVWYDITVDNEEQNDTGMLDDFDLYDGLALNPALFPPNLNFFKARYLQR
jgi:sRNA-binding regulator protein Hfq